MSENTYVNIISLLGALTGFVSVLGYFLDKISEKKAKVKIEVRPMTETWIDDDDKKSRSIIKIIVKNFGKMDIKLNNFGIVKKNGDRNNIYHREILEKYFASGSRPLIQPQDSLDFNFPIDDKSFLQDLRESKKIFVCDSMGRYFYTDIKNLSWG